VPLQKRQGNELFLKIVEGGLSPSDCRLTHDDDRGATISHLPSGSYFRVFLSGNALAWTVYMKVDYGPQTQKYHAVAKSAVGIDM
jgi:hypothetical protein